MKAVPFTQFLRPDGAKRFIAIDRSDHIAGLAYEMHRAGWRFEIEELSNGMVSMTIEDDAVDEQGAIAHVICGNGPPALDAVDRLIERAYRVFKERVHAS